MIVSTAVHFDTRVFSHFTATRIKSLLSERELLLVRLHRQLPFLTTLVPFALCVLCLLLDARFSGFTSVQRRLKDNWPDSSTAKPAFSVARARQCCLSDLLHSTVHFRQWPRSLPIPLLRTSNRSRNISTWLPATLDHSSRRGQRGSMRAFRARCVLPSLSIN